MEHVAPVGMEASDFLRESVPVPVIFRYGRGCVLRVILRDLLACNSKETPYLPCSF